MLSLLGQILLVYEKFTHHASSEMELLIPFRSLFSRVQSCWGRRWFPPMSKSWFIISYHIDHWKYLRILACSITRLWLLPCLFFYVNLAEKSNLISSINFLGLLFKFNNQVERIFILVFFSVAKLFFIFSFVSFICKPDLLKHLFLSFRILFGQVLSGDNLGFIRIKVAWSTWICIYHGGWWECPFGLCCVVYR